MKVKTTKKLQSKLGRRNTTLFVFARVQNTVFCLGQKEGKKKNPQTEN